MILRQKYDIDEKQYYPDIKESLEEIETKMI